MSKRPKKLSNSAILEVSLNPTLDPQVIISSRDFDAKGQKIRWIRSDDVHEFNFTNLNFLTQVYFNRQSIDLDGQLVKCRNRAQENDHKYEYEIVVSYNGNVYTSTKSGAPGGGKPVIRN